MQKDQLKEIMFDQKNVFNNRKHLIRREIELDRYIQTSQVVIITGIRRCGKSSLLYLIKTEMQLNDSDFCYFNFDDERIISDTSILEELYNLHLEVYGKDPILFFDEIQNVANWEKFINRKYEQGIKIFVTGSNAKMLSSEISTSLTGRNRLIELFPFSFAEYLSFKVRSYDLDHLAPNSKALLKKDFNEFIQVGGFPLVIKENDTELLNTYFQDILYRDIISRYRISQISEIRQIALYLVSNIGKLFSYNTLQTISGIKSLSSIKDYLSYYEQSYLFFYLKKFDYSVKKQIMNSRKVFMADPAFIHRLGFHFSENNGRILENIVFLELIRRKNEVFYHSGKNECDFLVMNGLNITEAIQVVYQLDNSNFEREYNGLTEAMLTYQIPKGKILVMDQTDNLPPMNDQIEIIPCWKWLLTRSKNN